MNNDCMVKFNIETYYELVYAANYVMKTWLR